MKKSTTVSAVVFILSISSFVFADDTAPSQVWSQGGPAFTEDRGASPNSGSIYYGGGVFDGNFYTGQLNYGPLTFAQTQTGEPATAIVKNFDIALLELTDPPAAPPLASYSGARSAVAIGDYVFFNRTNKQIGQVHVTRLNSDGTNPVAFSTDNNGNDVAPEGMATDGTSLFITASTSKNVIRKYSIVNEAGSFSLTRTLNVAVTGASTFRGLSYYNGKLYVVDNAGTQGIYEIDASTGTVTQLGTHAAAGGYQAVRYGNRLLVVGTDDKVTVYTIAGGALGTGTGYDLGHGDLYGIGVVGTRTEITNLWVTYAGGFVAFYQCSFSIVTCNSPFADADGDRDVDQDDFGVFQACFSGTGDGIAAEPRSNYFCACFDMDNSTRVDVPDLAAFVNCFTGPAVPWVASDDCP